MNLSQSMGTRQTQTIAQVRAPHVVLKMLVLQQSQVALRERIQQELEENPALEAIDVTPDEPANTEEKEDPDAMTTEEKTLVVDDSQNNRDDFERLVNFDENTWSDNTEWRPRRSRGGQEEDDERLHDQMVNIESRRPTLHDALIAQLDLQEAGPDLREMAETIIYSLDRNGYLYEYPGDLFNSGKGSASPALVQQAIELVQGLDPPGVGARSLKECLQLQLRPDMDLYDRMKALVDYHLEDLEHNRIPIIQRKTGMSCDEIEETLQKLRKLDPKPGAAFAETRAPTVIPEVFLDLAEDGDFRVRLEDKDLPQLFISRTYRKMANNDQAREWIHKKLNAALWLIDAIQNRRDTLIRVAQAIVDHQKDFLICRTELMQPLAMLDIAIETGLHRSTISRAVKDKWIETSRGIFPLKQFFARKITAVDGETVASSRVQAVLRQLVENEDKQRPFSDDELVEELAERGFNLARRTLTKYRKVLGIPNSHQRRSWKTIL